MPRHLRKCRNYDITANIYMSNEVFGLTQLSIFPGAYDVVRKIAILKKVLIFSRSSLLTRSMICLEFNLCRVILILDVTMWWQMATSWELGDKIGIVWQGIHLDKIQDNNSVSYRHSNPFQSLQKQYLPSQSEPVSPKLADYEKPKSLLRWQNIDNVCTPQMQLAASS
jgi:hypothetical protein